MLQYCLKKYCFFSIAREKRIHNWDITTMQEFIYQQYMMNYPGIEKYAGICKT